MTVLIISGLCKGNGIRKMGMIQDVRNIKNHYAQSQDKVKADMFRRLYNVMRALSEPEEFTLL